VVAEFRQTLSVAVQKFDMERFDLKKLRNMGVEEEYPVKISTTHAALENLDVWGHRQDLRKY
jgi:hypothetical protein